MELSQKPLDEQIATASNLNETPAETSAAEVKEETNPIIPEPVADEVLPQPEEKVATAAELLDELRALAAKPAEEIATEECARIKRQFYYLHNSALRAQRDEFVANGGDAEAFVAPVDPTEEEFKSIMSEIHDKKAAQRAEQERLMAEHLTAKKEIIAKIREYAADTDNVNRHYQEVKELQAKFKEIGDVTPQATADTWKDYQDAVETFYDQFKINMELRDYDFKKNLADKQLLIEQAQKLPDEPDPIVAFRRLQVLHDKWREIGPVAKELRESLWAEFKEASTVINKRHQEFFEKRKEEEQQNEAAKTALCEKVESIDFSDVKSYNGWDAITKEILAAQEEWKKLGFASRKVNNELFSRFRATCDKFFAAKAEFYKAMKDELAENLRKKTALVERAEALKDSTEWRKTTDELVELQKQWKQIGAVAKKQSDAIWKRFHEACDYFFEKKKAATGGQRAAEAANLKAKQALIDSLKAITEDMPREEAIARLKEVQAEWGTIGHVPFRDKDKIYDAYHQLTKELSKRLDLRGVAAGLANFAESIDNIATDDSNKLYRERERIARALEQRKNELHTYQNNLGFFNSKSKAGDKMVKEMERKMERIKEDIAVIQQKLALIDSKL